jgi:hypothetical protein
MGDGVQPLQGSTTSGLVTLSGWNPPMLHWLLCVSRVFALQLRVRWQREREEGGSRHRVQVQCEHVSQLRRPAHLHLRPNGLWLPGLWCVVHSLSLRLPVGVFFVLGKLGLGVGEGGGLKVEGWGGGGQQRCLRFARPQVYSFVGAAILYSPVCMSTSCAYSPRGRGACATLVAVTRCTLPPLLSMDCCPISCR